MYIIISVKIEKHLTKSNIHFWDKTRNHRGLSQPDKDSCEKPMAKIILNVEKQYISLRLGTRQGCLLPPLI